MRPERLSGGALLEPRRVGDPHQAAAEGCDRFLAVTRQPGLVCDQRLTPSDKAVEQAALADIRSAGDHDKRGFHAVPAITAKIRLQVRVKRNAWPARQIGCGGDEDCIGRGMKLSTSTEMETRPVVGPEGVVFAVLLAISFSHFLNDTMQSLLPAIYPTLKTKFSLNFGQIGLLTFVFQVTASLLQPVVGMVTDKRARSLIRWRPGWGSRCSA